MVDALRSAFDRQHGGFGAAQKFPNPEAIDFLLSEFTKSGDEETKGMIALTLDRMAAGEIHDDIEGGFFRYATERDWSSPHYEKMLDLNAELARNYASASLALGKKGYRTVLEGTIGYIMKNLCDRKTGVFYGSQDADEGYYTAKKRGPPPRVDTTIYAGPNAQMITALVSASGATGSKEYLDQAKKTAGFMIRNLYSEKKGSIVIIVKGTNTWRDFLQTTSCSAARSSISITRPETDDISTRPWTWPTSLPGSFSIVNRACSGQVEKRPRSGLLSREGSWNTTPLFRTSGPLFFC